MTPNTLRRVHRAGWCAAWVAGIALAATSSSAAPVNAQPSVLGVQAGFAQTAAEADNGIDASGILGLFWRRGFSHRWALQFDVNRMRHDDWGVVSSTASVMHAFGDSRWLVPMVRIGAGYDVATGRDDDVAMHAEVAAILELRLDGGFVLGADVSFGGRTVFPVPCEIDDGAMSVTPDSCGGPSVFRSTYRAARLTLGVAF